MHAPATSSPAPITEQRRTHRWMAPRGTAFGSAAADSGLPSAGMLLRAVGELLLGLVVASLVSLALQWVINRLELARPSNLPSVVITLGGGAAVLLIVVLVLGRRWRSWFTPLAWAALAAAGTVPLSAVLSGTRYYLGGLSIDQSFRTGYLTRLTDSAALADFAYRDIPPYYPAGWFWLGGRFANLTAMPAWAAFKPFAILTVSAVGVVAFVLWSLSVRRCTALALSAVSVIFALPVSALEPYSWMVAGTVPPLAVLAWRLLHTVAQRRRVGFATTIALGVSLGVYGCLYTLYFFFAGFVVVLLGGACLLLRPGSSELSRVQVLRRVVPHAVVVVVLAGAVMCLVWTPYLLGVARGMRGHNVAAQFLPPDSAQLPMPFLQVTLTGALCLVGLLWLVASVRRTGPFAEVAVALTAMVVGCYLWYLLSQLALLNHTTLLAFRIGPVLTMTLVCAAVLGIVELLGQGAARVGAQWRWPLRASAAILAVAALMSPLQALPSSAQHDIALAFEDYYPTGRTAGGIANLADDGYWLPALNDTIGELTGRPPDQNVVLGGPAALVDTSPYWLFQALTAHYANPLAEYEQRRELVGSWARAGSGTELAAALSRSPFTPPGVFVFRHDGPKLTLQLSKNVFPRNPNAEFYDVVFSRAVFDGPQFRSRDVGPFTVVTRDGTS